MSNDETEPDLDALARRLETTINRGRAVLDTVEADDEGSVVRKLGKRWL